MTVKELKNILDRVIEMGKGDYEVDFWLDGDDLNTVRHKVEEVSYRDCEKKVYL